MSEDVITLDSSDEESNPTARDKNPTVIVPPISINPLKQKKPPISMTGPISIKRPGLSKKHRTIGVNPLSMTPIRGPSVTNMFPIKMGNTTLTRPNFQYPAFQGPNSFSPIKPNLRNLRSFTNIPIQNGAVSIRPITPNYNMPYIVNTTSLPKKKTDSQKYLNSLPAGITITRKPGNDVQNKIPPGITVTRMSGNVNNSRKRPLLPNKVSITKRLRTTNYIDPLDIPTVELDDDDEEDANKDDNAIDNVDQQVGHDVPIEFDAEPSRDDDTKENEMSSITIEVPPMVSSTIDNSRVFEDMDHDSQETSQDNLETNEAEKSPMAASDELMDKSDFYTPKKIIENDKENIKSVNDTTLKNINLELGISGSEEYKNTTCVSDTNKNNIDADVEIEEVKEDTIEEVIETQSPENESKNPIVKEVIVKIVMKPEDSELVEDYRRNTPKKNREPDDMAESRINNTYQSFIDLCLRLDNSDDMKKIVKKKIKAYYLSVNPRFADSRSFCKFVEEKIQNIKSNPDSLFLYIKEVVDELKVRRVKPKKYALDDSKVKKPKDEEPTEEKVEASNQEEEAEEDEEDSVANRRIRKLEKAMRKLNKAIEKLEEREVDYSDEDNSAYLLADRYKARLIRVYQKLCSLTGERDEARNLSSVKGLSRLALCSGRFPKLVSAVKAAASSKPHWFPDFVDVLRCVEHCAKEQGLNLRSDELQKEAREAFIEIGTLLQQKRRESEYEQLSWRLGQDHDPADQDPTLAAALQKNRELYKHREMELLNKFAEKQTTMKLVPELVADGDADKSEGSESDEEGSEKSDDEADSEKGSSKSKDSMKKQLEEGESSRSKAKLRDQGAESTMGNEIVEDTSTTAKHEEDSYEAKLEDKTDSEISDKEPVNKKLRDKKSNSSKRDTSQDDEATNSSHTSVSNLSLVELSSSDSRDSLNSGGEADNEDSKYNGRFKSLQKIRPSSAMSGVNVIEDGNSLSDGKVEQAKEITLSSSLVLEIDESNDTTESSTACMIDDDNAVDQTLINKNAESEDSIENSKKIDSKMDETVNKSRDENIYCIDVDDDTVSSSKVSKQITEWQKIENGNAAEVFEILDSPVQQVPILNSNENKTKIGHNKESKNLSTVFMEIEETLVNKTSSTNGLRNECNIKKCDGSTTLGNITEDLRDENKIVCQKVKEDQQSKDKIIKPVLVENCVTKSKDPQNRDDSTEPVIVEDCITESEDLQSRDESTEPVIVEDCITESEDLQSRDKTTEPVIVNDCITESEDPQSRDDSTEPVIVEDCITESEDLQSRDESTEPVIVEDCITESEDLQSRDESTEPVIVNDCITESEDPQSRDDSTEPVIVEDCITESEDLQSRDESTEPVIVEDCITESEDLQSRDESTEPVIVNDCITESEDLQSRDKTTDPVIVNDCITESEDLQSRDKTTESGIVNDCITEPEDLQSKDKTTEPVLIEDCTTESKEEDSVTENAIDKSMVAERVNTKDESQEVIQDLIDELKETSHTKDSVDLIQNSHDVQEEAELKTNFTVGINVEKTIIQSDHFDNVEFEICKNVGDSDVMVHNNDEQIEENSRTDSAEGDDNKFKDIKIVSCVSINKDDMDIDDMETYSEIAEVKDCLTVTEDCAVSDVKLIDSYETNVVLELKEGESDVEMDTNLESFVDNTDISDIFEDAQDLLQKMKEQDAANEVS